MKLNRGDIVIANLESVSKGSIQKYTRPYIIISNTMIIQKQISLVIRWQKRLQKLSRKSQR